MYYETGASERIPFRKMFNSSEEAVRDINKYKSYSNVYHSIYGFREIEEKYDYLTGKTHQGPNYETAEIDRIVLDLDAYEKTKIHTKTETKEFESYTHRALDDLRTVNKWAEKQDLLRQYRMSGGGFYFIFSAKGHPLKLRDFELQLRNDLDIRIDVSTIGDTSRMMRVTNSYNFKKYRKCYCIPLTEEEIWLPYEKIKILASKPRYGERYIYGTETYDFSHFKLDKDKIKLKKLRINLQEAKTADADDILKPYGWEVNDFCDTIKGILSNGHVGNSLRIELIKYFKTIVKVSFEDCVKLLISLLGSEGLHSAMEKQAQYAYKGGWVFNPDKLKGLGLCPFDCKKCLMYRNIFFGEK